MVASSYLGSHYLTLHGYPRQTRKRLKYLSELPHHVGYVMAAVFALGLPYSLYRRRDSLTSFSLLWLCSWYVFYTTDSPDWVGNERFASIFYPAFAVISAQMVSDFADRLSSSLLAGALRYSFVAINVISCTVFPLSPVYVKYSTFHDSQERFVPYDQALRFIGLNIAPNKRILCTMGPNPLLFYAKKFHLTMFWDETRWTEPADQNPDNLFSYCKLNRIDLILFPGNPRWTEGYLNPDLLLRISRGQDPRFRLIHATASGSNTLLLFAVEHTNRS